MAEPRITRASPSGKRGERPVAGTALLAGTNDHLTFKAGDRLGYTPEPRGPGLSAVGGCVFESVCTLWPAKPWECC